MEILLAGRNSQKRQKQHVIWGANPYPAHTQSWVYSLSWSSPLVCPQSNQTRTRQATSSHVAFTCVECQRIAKRRSLICRTNSKPKRKCSAFRSWREVAKSWYFSRVSSAIQGQQSHAASHTLEQRQVLGSDCEASHSCLDLLCTGIPLSEQNMLLFTASVSTGGQTAPMHFLRNDIKKAKMDWEKWGQLGVGIYPIAPLQSCWVFDHSCKC